MQNDPALMMWLIITSSSLFNGSLWIVLSLKKTHIAPSHAVLSWVSYCVVPMALMFRLQRVHLWFALPLALLLLPGGTISNVCLPSHLSSKPPLLAFQHLSSMFIVPYIQPLPLVIVPRMVACPSIHIQIFFVWELVIGTVAIPCSVNYSWTIILRICLILSKVR